MVQVSATAVSVGRAYVPRHTLIPPTLVMCCTQVLMFTFHSMDRMCFAYTQSSSCLLESVCRCVQMNEPVLLVGETGVGKTAVINFLSQLTGNYSPFTSTLDNIIFICLGNKLVVFNVCQQTDTSELLGGLVTWQPPPPHLCIL